MSKAKEYYKKLQGDTKINFPYAIKMNHKTLEDVSDAIHDCYTEEWSDEVGYFIDAILLRLQKLKL